MLHVTLAALRDANVSRFVYRSSFFVDKESISLVEWWLVSHRSPSERIEDLRALGATGERIIRKFVHRVLSDPKVQIEVDEQDAELCANMRKCIESWQVGPETEELCEETDLLYRNSRNFIENRDNWCLSGAYYVVLAHLYGLLTTNYTLDVFTNGARFADSIELIDFDSSLLLWTAICEVENEEKSVPE